MPPSTHFHFRLWDLLCAVTMFGMLFGIGSVWWRYLPTAPFLATCGAFFGCAASLGGLVGCAHRRPALGAMYALGLAIILCAVVTGLYVVVLFAIGLIRFLLAIAA